MSWQYFVLGLVAYQILKMLALAINRAVIEHRQKKFLKFVQVTFPDDKKIAFIAIDSSDKRSMSKLERQIREQYNLPEKVDLASGQALSDSGSAIFWRDRPMKRSRPNEHQEAEDEDRS